MNNIFLCSNCGREYDYDGWEIGKENQGNNYIKDYWRISCSNNKMSLW